MQIPGKYQSFSPLSLKPWILSLFATLETRKSWNAYQLFVGSLLAPASYSPIFHLFLVTVPEVLTKYLVQVSISFLKWWMVAATWSRRSCHYNSRWMQWSISVQEDSPLPASEDLENIILCRIVSSRGRDK